MSDLLRCCETFDWHGRDECSFIFICIGEACEHARIRSARSDYVYPNSAPCDFQCCGFGHSFHRMFAGYVNGCSGSTDASIGRRDIDDAPAPLWQHHPQFVLHAQQHAEHIGVEGGGVALGGLIDDQAPLALGTGIVDGGVDPAEAGHGLIDQVAHLVFVTDVGLDERGFGAEAAKFGLESLAFGLAAAGDDEAGAGLGKGDGPGAAYACEGSSGQNDRLVSWLCPLTGARPRWGWHPEDFPTVTPSGPTSPT